MSPFDTMYASFKLFSESGKRWMNDFVPMSAGVNWMQANPSVMGLLKAELESSETYRNYGRASGLRPITDVLELVENSHVEDGDFDLAVSIVNGTTEGACLCIELLMEEGLVTPGDRAVMIGHGFPLYSLLSSKFGLVFEEVLGDDSVVDTFLPSIAEVIEHLSTSRPSLIFLLVPNNPFGETYSTEDLSSLLSYCQGLGIHILIDRVCQLAWDDRSTLMRAMAPGIQQGLVFVADSFSKSESLAGLRTGFLISSPEWRARLEALTKERFLNPVVFSTVTLAMTRLAESNHRTRQKAARLLLPYLDALHCEYPKAEARMDVEQVFEAFCSAYDGDRREKNQRLTLNYERTVETFQAKCDRRLNLSSGFNVVLELPQMLWTAEQRDRESLSNECGVGVLTEACFRASKRSSGHYFIRLGLTLTNDEYAEGLVRLDSYYSSRP